VTRGTQGGNTYISFIAAVEAAKFSGALAVILAMTLASAPSWGTEDTLPQPLHLNDALRTAREQRAEIRAAGARAEAARQRPAIVSALEDPVLAPSIDHKPVDPMMETDRSITLEQSFPLSRIRGHRRSPTAHREAETAKAHRG